MTETVPLVVFSHGKDTGPWGTKIRVLADVARAALWQVLSGACRGYATLSVKAFRPWLRPSKSAPRLPQMQPTKPDEPQRLAGGCMRVSR